jgi:hypothetical protein
MEEIMNWLADMDWLWWPVVFLRPPKDRDIDNRVLLKMTPFFGPVIGLFPLLWVAFRGMVAATLVSITVFLLIGCVAFFAFSKFTFAVFWNRRARRLRSSQEKHDPVAE